MSLHGIDTSTHGGYLSGLVVLDLGQLHPGPYTAQLLQQLGATVIKVEKPGGDTSRALGRDTYAKYNRGKPSIMLDLKQADDRATLLRLARASDVLIEGFRPGVMARLGLAPATLALENPRLVICSITGFGQTGPYADRPGHDINYLALSGYWAVPSQVRDVAARPRLRLSDYCAAMHAALAILAAADHARKTGEGQHLDVSIHDAMTAWMAPGVDAVQRHGGPGMGLDHVMPDNDIFETADGRHIALGILEEKFWDALVNALGADFPLLRDPAYAQRAGRLAAKRDLNRQLREIFASRTRAQWEERLAGLDLPWAPVLEYDEVFENDHVRHRGVVNAQARGDGPGFPVRFSQSLPATAGRVAELNEDRTDILDWLRRKEDEAR
ncbi:MULTISPECIES: CaiB/BaiF CoA-transferase family protein [unclassified Achromobacter]|uniref:CaiB/BaiF CoA transferase family protein n=1 Tax=unclassified Achromobacter TaxID=2626865 RepID=UPI000B516361|nr:MULTISPECIES: CoA transferase [unclassified Achromobacter]OWT72872.1 CoA transferase [Achromobacter sp. HZ34]OWT74090.1 CoA transferase [Achromobacter sp. HZ28]